MLRNYVVLCVLRDNDNSRKKNGSFLYCVFIVREKEFLQKPVWNSLSDLCTVLGSFFAYNLVGNITLFSDEFFLSIRWGYRLNTMHTSSQERLQNILHPWMSEDHWDHDQITDQTHCGFCEAENATTDKSSNYNIFLQYIRWCHFIGCNLCFNMSSPFAVGEASSTTLFIAQICISSKMPLAQRWPRPQWLS